MTFRETILKAQMGGVIHRIRNNTDRDKNILHLYKENLEGLKDGQWVGNIIIDFFAWKLFKRLDRCGVKDVYKRFKIMDSVFRYYMYLAKGEYDFHACRCWVTNKSVDDDGHVWSFLSHEMIFVPVHEHNDHWVLFIICPVNREITVIDSLYDTIH
jgi:Ulp1 family protease